MDNVSKMCLHQFNRVGLERFSVRPVTTNLIACNDIKLSRYSRIAFTNSMTSTKLNKQQKALFLSVCAV